METKQHVTKKKNRSVKISKRKYLKTNENGNTTFHNWWNAAKAVLRGKFIVIQAYLKKQTKNLKQPNVLLKVIRKRRPNKAQSQQKKRNNKDQRGHK